MRSQLSFWVYRACIALVLLASFKSAQFMYEMFSEASAAILAADESNAVWVTALWSSFNTPILLFLISFSLVCRSGASVWLVAWLFLSEVAPVLFTSMENAAVGVLILLLSTVFIVILIVTSALVFLIRSGEIRKP